MVFKDGFPLGFFLFASEIVSARTTKAGKESMKLLRFQISSFYSAENSSYCQMSGMDGFIPSGMDGFILSKMKEIKICWNL